MKYLTVTMSVFGNGDDHAQFDYARVDIPVDLARRIKHLAAEVKHLDVYKIQLFDFRVQPLTGEPEDDWESLVESTARIDTVCLNVTSSKFFWSGSYKHQDAGWKTTSVPLTKLDEGPAVFDLRN
jgi:hypothetical protein